MNLQEAIERLQEDIDSTGNDEIDTLTEAERLLIGAGERELMHRQRIGPRWIWLLPGETKE